MEYVVGVIFVIGCAVPSSNGGAARISRAIELVVGLARV
jgi:hypothetical protein